MGQTELVRAEGVDFCVEVSGGDGPRTVGYGEALSFDGVRDTIRVISTEISEAWRHVRPNEASVEFGLSLTVKSGKLTGLLVEGSGAASLKVTLSWKGESAVADK